jgi:DNA-binding response OmpR family regulator
MNQNAYRFRNCKAYKIKGKATPIMILSGNTDEDTIVKGFDLV